MMEAFREAPLHPRSMRDPDVRERRRAMLRLAHIAPLTDFAASLRRPSVEVPDFDPLDGGMDASMLFLFEKPGPMTAVGGKRVGSGFISRDNDDPTAEATFNFMNQAGIPRRRTVSWNVVPWWNGERKITTSELREGAECVRELIALLPKLRVVVLVGKKAARARPHLETKSLSLFTSAHPSPLVRASLPDRWKAIPLEWASAARFAD
jgi:hypothetical protein